MQALTCALLPPAHGLHTQPTINITSTPNQLPTEPPKPDKWAEGLPQAKRYEWLCDCYRWGCGSQFCRASRSWVAHLAATRPPPPRSSPMRIDTYRRHCRRPLQPCTQCLPTHHRLNTPPIPAATRMRIDDDYAWNGGYLHGLYDPEATAQSVAEDFLVSCKGFDANKRAEGLARWAQRPHQAAPPAMHPALCSSWRTPDSRPAPHNPCPLDAAVLQDGGGAWRDPFRMGLGPLPDCIRGAAALR